MIVGYDTTIDGNSPSAICAECGSNDFGPAIREGDEWGTDQDQCCCEWCGEVIDVEVVRG